MEKSNGVILILLTFWNGYTKAWERLLVVTIERKVAEFYLLLDLHLLDTSASDDEVRVGLCDMVSKTHLCGSNSVRVSG
jgi:hypothetical protein